MGMKKQNFDDLERFRGGFNKTKAAGWACFAGGLAISAGLAVLTGGLSIPSTAVALGGGFLGGSAVGACVGFLTTD